MAGLLAVQASTKVRARVLLPTCLAWRSHLELLLPDGQSRQPADWLAPAQTQGCGGLPTAQDRGRARAPRRPLLWGGLTGSLLMHGGTGVGPETTGFLTRSLFFPLLLNVSQFLRCTHCYSFNKTGNEGGGWVVTSVCGDRAIGEQQGAPGPRMQASSSGTGAGRSAEGSPAGTWGGSAFRAHFSAGQRAWTCHSC